MKLSDALGILEIERHAALAAIEQVVVDTRPLSMGGSCRIGSPPPRIFES
jgi:hypothetical protein